MLSINIYVKFALIAIGFIGGIALWSMYGFGWAWPFLILGIIMLVSYLMLGTVQSAALLVQDMNFEGAKKRLGLTAHPRLLYVTQRAFYYIMKASIATSEKDNKTAEELYDKALNLKLPSGNEKAMILLQLANINANKGKWTIARNYFKEAKKLKVTEGQIKEQIGQFEKALSNRGQAKLAGSMGQGRMQGGGGKRRRPKMR